MTQTAFTLAETLIVIGIIGVVAALTLPNLNHATGDKETVTRVKKSYSMLNEANDRAVAIYGPISEWSDVCHENLNSCYMNRISEFLKVSKSCNEAGDENESTYSSCDSLAKGDMPKEDVMVQVTDGMTFTINQQTDHCTCDWNIFGKYPRDICIEYLSVDINGPNKGKNKYGQDIFIFIVSDSLGVIPPIDADTVEDEVNTCLYSNRWDNSNYYHCSWWVLEYGNLDYLKADYQGKCNDNPSIILDGVNNTSCH